MKFQRQYNKALLPDSLSGISISAMIGGGIRGKNALLSYLMMFCYLCLPY